MTGAFRTPLGSLAWRSILGTLRQPTLVIPSLMMPLILLAVTAGGLHAAVHLPGFPTHSYLTFALAATFLNGAVFAVNAAGGSLARDIQTGFLDRLALTPAPRPVLLSAQLAGVAVLGAIQASVFLAVGLAAGANVVAGIPGAMLVIGLAVLTSLAFGALGAMAALRTGSGEAVQAIFPVLLMLLFLSSMYLPRDLIAIGWFRAVATVNPISYLIEGIRSLLITGWDPQALGIDAGVVVAVLALGVAGASHFLNERVIRS